MGKWYEVVLHTTTVFAVEMPNDTDEDDLQNFALQEFPSIGNTEIQEMRLVTDPVQIESINRHADERFPL